MKQLTIKITDISGGRGTAYKAVIPELNNSVICADKIADIFKMVPEAIEEAKKHSFGSYFETGKSGNGNYRPQLGKKAVKAV
jgi:hypothetical protein